LRTCKELYQRHLSFLAGVLDTVEVLIFIFFRKTIKGAANVLCCVLFLTSACWRDTHLHIQQRRVALYLRNQPSL
jgi:hypothetical protein